MNIINYKNISKLTIVATIILILANTLLISLVYYKNQLIEYDNMLQNLKDENIISQKRYLKKDIENIIKMIEFKYS
ncbi:MAG: hypothetical protein U9O56_03815, partial [Campylobacterota bacterium]|nr:hypothetical protein [Campylobacterota bacterium]